MKKTMQWFAVVVTAVLLLVGCQTSNQGAKDTNRNTDVEQTRNNDGDTARKMRRDVNNNNRDITRNVNDGNRENNGNRINNGNRTKDNNFRSNHRSSNNRQDKYDVSKEAADRIVEEITDIDHAYVITTRNNAYVAAVLNQNTTPNDPLTKNDRRHNSTGTNVRNTNDRNVKNRTVNEGDSNRRGPDNHMSNRRDTESDDVTDDVKNEIADIVQDIDRNIDNVYVSTSPDFVDLAGNYVDDMDNGKPVRGFFDQIGNTIERIFPQSKR